MGEPQELPVECDVLELEVMEAENDDSVVLEEAPPMEVKVAQKAEAEAKKAKAKAEAEAKKAKAEKEAAEKAKAKAEAEAKKAKAEKEAAEKAKAEAEAKKAEAEKEAAEKAKAEAEAKKAVAEKEAKKTKKVQTDLQEMDPMSLSVSADYQGLCVGWVKANDAPSAPMIMAACAKTKEDTCPAVFNATSCKALRPIGAKVVQDAKMMML